MRTHLNSRIRSKCVPCSHPPLAPIAARHSPTERPPSSHRPSIHRAAIDRAATEPPPSSYRAATEQPPSSHQAAID
eukprot:6731840-Prymnesium_polylepis.1